MTLTSRNIWKFSIIGIVVLCGLWLFSSYNALVTERENADTSWRQVATQYQRRFNLVPNLVSTVRGEANFEQGTLTAVTNARTQWLNAAGNRKAQVAAAERTESALARLLVTVENYPTLNATKGFQDLMVQLEGTENRIAVARRDYNETVRNYNLLVRRFPGNIVAGLFGYDVEPGFDAAPGSDTAPTVDFNQ